MSNRFSFYSSFVNTNFTNNSFDTMENTIYHFLFNFSLFNSLSSCFKISIESSKGLYSLFINNYPYFNVNIISSDFLMINNLNKFCKNINLADLITILGSVDFVLGSIDLATTTNTTIYE
jgi:NADH:ubiquinone oxidoreductase subunit D